MTNAVVDRVDFDGANLSSVNFTNAVVTGASFKGARASAGLAAAAAAAARAGGSGGSARVLPGACAPARSAAGASAVARWRRVAGAWRLQLLTRPLPAPWPPCAGTDLSNTIWEDALIGGQDAKKLCECLACCWARGCVPAALLPRRCCAAPLCWLGRRSADALQLLALCCCGCESLELTARCRWRRRQPHPHGREQAAGGLQGVRLAGAVEAAEQPFRTRVGLS
jgi:hypothetical protein